MEKIDGKRRYLKQSKSNNKSDEGTSLEKENIEQNITSDETKTDEEAIKPFIEMFDKGFNCDKNIFFQIRMEKAQIKIDKKLKLVFHPTYLITSQVFN